MRVMGHFGHLLPRVNRRGEARGVEGGGVISPCPGAVIADAFGVGRLLS